MEVNTNQLNKSKAATDSILQPSKKPIVRIDTHSTLNHSFGSEGTPQVEEGLIKTSEWRKIDPLFSIKNDQNLMLDSKRKSIQDMFI